MYNKVLERTAVHRRKNEGKNGQMATFDVNKLRSPSGRKQLERRKAPYWQILQQGRKLGYRRGKKSGVWLGFIEHQDLIGRKNQNGEANVTGRLEFKIGRSDDQVDGRAINPDGMEVLSYPQAVKRAWEKFDEYLRLDDSDIDKDNFTVANAVKVYLDHYEAEGKTALENTKYAINTHILPALGSVRLVRLTTKRLTDWLHQLARQPARKRSAKGGEQNYRDLSDDPEELRKRRATANRVRTHLVAALNLACEQHGFDDKPWRSFRPFKKVDAAKVEFLSDDEMKRLTNASSGAFKQLLLAAFYSGARYGELGRMRVRDFDAENGSIFIAQTKSGQERHVDLSEEGIRHFENAAIGKSGTDLLFSRDDNKAWKKSQQTRPLHDACERANIRPLGFHAIRHTYASRLVKAGHPLLLVAEQLGHSSIRMVEKHYGHFQRDYKRKLFQESFQDLGLIGTESNVTRFMDRRA